MIFQESPSKTGIKPSKNSGGFMVVASADIIHSPGTLGDG
jgi:hypothetical protein